jgi:hypothetical protein
LFFFFGYLSFGEVFFLRSVVLWDKSLMSARLENGDWAWSSLG